MDRQRGNGAFRKNTCANDHGLDDTFICHAWVGDHALNLALADRIDASSPSSFYWGGTFPQLQAQSREVAYQVVSIFAGTQGHLDDIEVDQVRVFEKDLHAFIEAERSSLLDDVRKAKKKPELNKVAEDLTAAIKTFKESWKPSA